MNKSDKAALVPRLRFPEYAVNGAIDFETGDVIFETISNKNHNSDLAVLAITQEHGAIPRDQIDYNVSVMDKSLESYKVVEIGDFIISLRSFQGGIEYSLYHGICSPAYIIIRKRFSIVEQYYKYYFKTGKFIQDLNKDLEGIRDGKMVSYSQFSAIMLPKPDNNEQQKIADCLSSLDDLISAEDKKLEALKAHKKGLMQKLFPAEGKTVPEIRFEGYTDAWKQQKLGEVAELSSSKRIHVSDYVPEGIPFYRGSEISAGGVSQNGELFILEELYNEIKEKYGVPIEGDLLITAVGTLGNIWKVDDRRFYYKDGNLIRLSNLKIEADYLIAYFSEGQGKLKILDSAAGSSQKALTMVKLNQVLIFVPSLPEQIAISTFFRNLDELITGQAKKIDALKLHKKGLMQGLFPSIEEVGE